MLELVNEPVQFKLGNKSLFLHRIGSIKRQAIVESFYLEKLVSEINVKSQAISDPIDRKKWITDELAKLPSGDDLAKQALSSPLTDAMIYRFIQHASDPQLSVEEIEIMFREASVEEVASVMYFLVNLKKKSTPLKKAVSQRKGLRKNTGTARNRLRR